MRPPRGHWARAQNLRFIQTIGAGVDSVLPAPDLPERVLIANARGLHADHMSEFAIALLLAMAQRLTRLLEQQRERRPRLPRPVGRSWRIRPAAADPAAHPHQEYSNQGTQSAR